QLRGAPLVAQRRVRPRRRHLGQRHDRSDRCPLGSDELDRHDQRRQRGEFGDVRAREWQLRRGQQPVGQRYGDRCWRRHGCNGATGTLGIVSISNSLVGSTTNDAVGTVTVLANGNYVARANLWDNGAIVDAGAATWANGTTGVSGVISAANSLVGTAANANL